MLVLAATAALVALIPFAFVVAYAVDAGWDVAWSLIVRDRVAELLANTIALVTATIAACAVIGMGAAWLVERTALPGRRVWNVLLTTPLAVPAFVNSYGWVSLSPGVAGYSGAVMVTTLSYYPFVYLPVAASLRRLDPSLEETARSLGRSPRDVFRRITLRQLRNPLLGGSLLVGLHLLGEFGALQLLRFDTFTTAIYDQYRSSFNGPAANLLAVVLLLLCIVFLLGELVSSRHHESGTSGTPREIARQPLGRLLIPAVVVLTTVVVSAIGVPLYSLLRWLVVGSSTSFAIGDLFRATSTSVGLGIAAAVVTTSAALPVAWLSVRYPGRIAVLVERSVYFGTALPGIVVALSLVTFAVRLARPVYQTVILLVVAYLVMFLPRSVVSTRASIAQSPRVLEDVSKSLGVGGVRCLFRVTGPLIAPGLGAGAALVFLATMNELTATLLLSPTSTETLATRFWVESSSIAYGAAAPYAAAMIAVSVPATYFLTRSSRWNSLV